MWCRVDADLAELVDAFIVEKAASYIVVHPYSTISVADFIREELREKEGL